MEDKADKSFVERVVSLQLKIDRQFNRLDTIAANLTTKPTPNKASNTNTNCTNSNSNSNSSVAKKSALTTASPKMQTIERKSPKARVSSPRARAAATAKKIGSGDGDIFKVIRNAHHPQLKELSAEYNSIESSLHASKKLAPGLPLFVGCFGSRFYNVFKEDSDFDVFCLYIWPTEVVLGLNAPPEYVVNAESEKPDFGFYDPRKMVKILLDCSPKGVEVLFASPKCVSLTTPAFQELVEYRDLFICKNLVRCYVKHLTKETKTLSKELAYRVTKGFQTGYADDFPVRVLKKSMVAQRLIYTIEYLLADPAPAPAASATGAGGAGGSEEKSETKSGNMMHRRFLSWLEDDDAIRLELLEIREGQFCLSTLVRKANRMIADAEFLLSQSSLPEDTGPAEKHLTEWLMKLRQSFWTIE